MLRLDKAVGVTFYNTSFNGHPPLGVNATCRSCCISDNIQLGFQWAPTLGGECYDPDKYTAILAAEPFQWAPTLGGECYFLETTPVIFLRLAAFQWAPTLGGECYVHQKGEPIARRLAKFQWAPTLGGECYCCCVSLRARRTSRVSMGTHPWG